MVFDYNLVQCCYLHKLYVLSLNSKNKLGSVFLLTHLELCSRSAMPWPVVRRPLLAFHTFDISSRTISWIELKHSGTHCGNMEIQNCLSHSVRVSKMAAMVAILKFFKRYLLPNRKSNWAKTWWEASQWHRNSELLKSFSSDIQDGRAGIWNSSNNISSQTISQIERHRDSKLPKWFHFDIQDGRHRSWNSSNDISKP